MSSPNRGRGGSNTRSPVRNAAKARVSGGSTARKLFTSPKNTSASATKAGKKKPVRDQTAANRYVSAFARAARPDLGYTKEHLNWLRSKFTPSSEEWDVGMGLIFSHRVEAFLYQAGVESTPCWRDVNVISFRKCTSHKIASSSLDHGNCYFADVETKIDKHRQVVYWAALRVFPCTSACCVLDE